LAGYAKVSADYTRLPIPVKTPRDSGANRHPDPE
jgi:hypothetical protein